MSSSRRQYPFHLIEPKWQKIWDEQQAFRAFNPGDEIPASHPFAQRHKLSGKVSAAQLPPKFYILDMFPYPSGAGLHVGHPEGYTATDILARYKRARGFNVLHPMGWDAFGLPAEQYAVKTGQHPRKTTDENIATFKRQIKSLGFSYDWSREIATTDPDYFKWTQWIFLKLYNSWFNPKTNKAEPIHTLEYPEQLQEPADKYKEIAHGVMDIGDKIGDYPLYISPDPVREAKRREYRDSKRLAFVTEAPVWWCEELGTVLANEEIVDGKSDVGGFPVVRKPMRQWMLRITKYAERLLQDLDTIDWTDSLKEMQRNWIGRSEGAEVDFCVAASRQSAAESVENKNGGALPSRRYEGDSKIRVFTTRPDTLFGATYMVVAAEKREFDHLIPEKWPSGTKNEWKWSSPLPPKEAINDYRDFITSLSDLQRTMGKTGIFSGFFAKNPVTNADIPVFFSEYVLGHYGTGAIMAVPAHDERDFEFAIALKLPVQAVVGTPNMKPSQEFIQKAGYVNIGEQHEWFEIDGKRTPVFFSNKICDSKEGYAVNSSNSEISLNGLPTAEAKKKITEWLQEKGLGKRTINYKLRDWLFSRQRYWGEPFPIVWKKDAAGNLHHEALPESTLPVLLPDLTNYKPIPILAVETSSTCSTTKCRVEQYLSANVIEMFKVAPQNETFRAIVLSKVGQMPDASLDTFEKIKDWIEQTFNPPIGAGEPPLARAKDWVNLPDGSQRETNTMPQWAGSCWYYLRYLDAKNEHEFVSKEAENYWMNPVAADGSHKSSGTLPSAATRQGVDLYVGGTEHAVLHLLYARFWHKVLYDLGLVSTPEPFFKLVNQGMVLGEDNQKMSKSRGNVIPVDVPVRDVGTDALRLFEMFIGPLEMVKPWSTKGVEGVYRFLGRVWRLFVDAQSETEFEQAETTAETQSRGELLNLIRLDPSIKDVAASPAQLKTLHACIKKVTEDLDGLRFNTAISALMVFVNEAMTWETKPVSVLRDFLILLQPFAPHLAEELWAKLPDPGNLAYSNWPAFDPALLVESEIEIPVQVNGKLRDVIKVPATASQAELETAAKNSEKVKPFIEGKTIKKIIVVPKKLINIVAV